MIDKIITEIDRVIKTLTTAPVSKRPHPDAAISECDSLSLAQKKHSLGLMRVNHCGEICAQALYQGQALTAKDKTNRDAFAAAALEETEHLAWTNQRINELGGKPSILNPLFYCASLAMGVTAGVIGDKWNLGFLQETEKQVEKHLEKHQSLLPEADQKSLAIVAQMKYDEHQHAQMAHAHGAAELPKPIKRLMGFGSKIMTKSAYYI